MIDITKIKKAKIICDINPIHSSYRIFYSYVSALKNIHSTTEWVEEGFDTLFIIDECFGPHRPQYLKYVNYCNENNIRVIIFNLEKIFNSHFPESLTVQKWMESFNNHIQYPVDLEDSLLLQKPPTKAMISKTIAQDILKHCNIIPFENKKNKILFKGSLYPIRKKQIQIIKQQTNLEVDVYEGNSGSFYDYMNLLNQYKYIIAATGTGIFLNPRFYEALMMQCKPIVFLSDTSFENRKDFNPEHLFKQFYKQEIQKSINASSPFTLLSTETSPYDLYLDDYITNNLYNQ